MSARLTRLDSGLTLVTETMPHLESAAIGIWCAAGARAERPEQHGISHLLEHMAFKGTRRRDARAIAEEIEAVGGEINAATSVENTAYYARVLADDTPLAVDILSDILTDSVFDAEELKREQHVIVQEIGAAFDTPEDRVFDLLQETAFPGQPIGRPILGTPETVRGFGPAAIRAYLDEQYRAPAMVLAAAGKVDHDALTALAERHLASLSAQKPAAPVAATYHGGDIREDRDTMEAQILIGFEGSSYSSTDYHAIQLMSSVLGGGMSSRLFQEVREKRGLCYSVYSFHWPYQETGLFGIHAATGEDDVAELVPVILGEIERLAMDAGEAELNRAKAQVRAALQMSRESPASRAGQLARQVMLFGRTLTMAEILAKVDAVTVADVRRVAETTFTKASPTIAAIGPVGKLISHDAVAARLGARATTVAAE
jgi:predicted Zn-dependent peptidase